MSWTVKLKTGFYETTNYKLSLSDGSVQLTTPDIIEQQEIIIVEHDLISITLTKNKNSEIEIITKRQAFTGTFSKNIDLREIYQALKMHMNIKIIYEEE